MSMSERLVHGLHGGLVLGLLVTAATASAQPYVREVRLAEDSVLLMEMARATSAPWGQSIAPERRRDFEEAVVELRRSRFDQGLTHWERFMRDTGQHLELSDRRDFAHHLLYRVYVERPAQAFEISRPGLPSIVRRARAAAYQAERVELVEDYLDQLDAILSRPRLSGYQHSVRRLHLGPRQPQRGVEPGRWGNARPAGPKELAKLRRDWNEKLVMVEEDAISAHVHLQASIDIHRSTVNEIALVAECLLGREARALQPLLRLR
ncbi:MAG: hypothetical protein AAF533_14060 [Acidobacteriota bacterium]